MQRLWLSPLLLLPLVCVTGIAEARQAAADTRERLDRVGGEVTHLATRDLIYNRWSEAGRWPVGMLEAQQGLLQQLREVSADRDGLRSLLQDEVPRVRTLALGALFLREDPHDLPFIARLMNDETPTMPLIDRAGTSMAGRLPLSSFESPQTVGDVAQDMLRFYLDATDHDSIEVPATPYGRARDLAPAWFDGYWAERGSRNQCASWFLVRMRRATRQTSPLQAEYEGDVRRVLADIDTLPPIERAWTLLYVRTDQAQIAGLVSDTVLAAALQRVGPDALMTFLRRELPTNDPDVRAGHVYPGSRTGFILEYAPQLLRPGDAAGVTRASWAYRGLGSTTMFAAAAARLHALEDVEAAASSLRLQIDRASSTNTPSPRDQAILALSLWQIRGAAERTHLTNWLYAALPDPRALFDLESFLRNVEKEARPDTPLLLSAIVNDVRFEQMGWSPLARLLEMVNRTRPTPLVEPNTIYNYRSGVEHADQQAVLTAWRLLLRQHFRAAR